MKMLIILAALSSSPQPAPPHNNYTQIATVCMFTGKQEQSGLNRICYYNCMGSEAAITINATDICPMQITR
jgi:hypothetical protein